MHINRLLKQFSLVLSRKSTLDKYATYKREHKEFDRQISQIKNFIQLNKINIDLETYHFIITSILSGHLKSQSLQDIFTWLLLDKKKNGFYIEFGADDGILNSNTYFLNKVLGWKGVLAEPNPNSFQKLQLNRKDDYISNLVIWSESDCKLSFDIAGQLSTVSDFASKDFMSTERQSGTSNKLEVKTISLIDLLIQSNAPQEIDFLSIDTEGSEYEVLKNFDFNTYKIKLICVEHNRNIEQKNLINSLLTKWGYNEYIIDENAIDSYYIMS